MSNSGRGKRVLVLGASGMLGSAAIRSFSSEFKVFAGVRSDEELSAFEIDAKRLRIDEDRLLTGFDARLPESVINILNIAQPDIVLNAVGIISQQPESASARLAIEVNSVWPHALAQICKERGIRLIHVSTDCVFSGNRGNYTEEDIPDATGLYGKSKMLGEVDSLDNVLTIRTSIVGWQFGPQLSLAGWFAAHRNDQISGYTHAIFSGLTTSALCGAIRDYVFPREDLHGLYQISSAPISKFQLLTLLAEKMNWDVTIVPSDLTKINKSLDSTRFQTIASWSPPSWDHMLEALAAEYSDYYIP